MTLSSTRPFAVVTGASDGIGYELARQFAENGFDLLVVAEDPGIAEAAQAFAGLGANVEKLQANLATPEGVEKLYQQIQAFGRPLDGIALNAGVGVGGKFVETDLQEELNLIALNVTAAVHLAKLVAKDMAARGKGRILFTSSISALMPSPFEAVYGASKSFLFSFAEALREELKDDGVTVTALLPGPTETNFFHRAGMDDTKVGRQEKDDPAEVARDGFKALMAGEDYVIAGALKNKLFGAVGRFLPERIKARIHRSMSEPRANQ
jgi:short-subunit dehydrogenase